MKIIKLSAKPYKGKSALRKRIKAIQKPKLNFSDNETQLIRDIMVSDFRGIMHPTKSAEQTPD